MKNKNLRRILYLCAVIVLLIMGVFVWMKTNKPVEEKTFIVNGQQEAIFEYSTKMEHPKILTVRLDGKLDCDGILVIKEKEAGNGIRFRRSFPVKAGELKDREALQTTWSDRELVLEFKTKECFVNDVKITVRVEG